RFNCHASRRRSGTFAGWKVGGVYGSDSGYGREPERDKFVDGAHSWRRCNSIDEDRQRFIAEVVAERKDDRIFICTQRGFASLCALDGGRRSASIDEDFYWCGHCEVVARWEDARVHLFGVPGL